MSSGRLFDLAVVFIVSGIGYLFGGPILGVILLGVGVILLVLSRQRTPTDYGSVTPPSSLQDMPSSSALIQFIRDAYRHQRAR